MLKLNQRLSIVIMGRFNKSWFKQIMINILIKNQLDQLKTIIRKQMNSNCELSYCDEIKFLIKYFRESKRIEVPLEPALLLGSSLSNQGLKISSKLDGKQRVSFSLEG